MAVLLAAAMPIRVVHGLPLISSASILDLVIVCLAVTLLLDFAYRPLDTGYPHVLALLSVPLLIAVVSLAWSQEPGTTLRAVLEYSEGLILFLVVIRELAGLPAARVASYITRYAWLLLAPPVLMLLHVPGFQPRVEVRRTSGDYLTYFSRFSHPVLGASNNLATVLAFVAPVLLYWGHARSDRRATLAGIMAGVGIVLTLSRGIMVSFALAALLYAPFASASDGRRRGGGGFGVRVGATVIGAFVALVGFYAFNPATHQFFANRLSSSNFHARAKAYSYALESIANDPLIGRGGGVIGAGPPVAATPVKLDPYDPAAASQPPPAPVRYDVHDTYLQQAIYYGIPLATVLSLALFGVAGAFVLRGRTFPLAGVIGYTILVQLVSFVFESSFEGTNLRLLFFLSIGLLVSLMRAAEQEAAPPPMPR
jgi:hypothetical protein